MVNSLKPDEVVAFLSCSIRQRDRELVDALDKRVFAPLGFRCETVGRNFSSAEQADDSIRTLMGRVHCLIGVATVRATVRDVDTPEQSLAFAAPYLLQETSMAFQRNLPFLIFKTPDVHLVGVTSRNLWLEVFEDLSDRGLPRFAARRELVSAALQELKTQALERRRVLNRQSAWDMVSSASTVTLGALAVFKTLDWLSAERDEPSTTERLHAQREILECALQFADPKRLRDVAAVLTDPVPRAKKARIQVVLDSDLSPEDVLSQVLTLQQLRQVCKALNVSASGSKAEIVRRLIV